MIDIKVRDCEPTSFGKYGQVIEAPRSQEPTIETDLITFWKQQAVYHIDGETEVGVLKVKKHDMVFNQLENHFESPTLLICLDGAYLIPVAGPSAKLPGVNEIQAFKVSEKQSILLSEACWHWTTYPLDRPEITLLVIFKKNCLDDDTVIEELDQQCRLLY